MLLSKETAFSNLLTCNPMHYHWAIPSILILTEKDFHYICGCQQGGGWGRDGVEAGVSRCKLLYMEWINSRSYCIAQRIIFSILWYTIMEKNIKKECVYIHVSTLFQILFPFRLLQNTEQSSLLLYSRSLLVIYFIYSSVYMSVPISQFIPPLPFPPW